MEMSKSVGQQAYNSLLFIATARREETTGRLGDDSVKHPEILSVSTSTASAGLLI